MKLSLALLARYAEVEPESGLLNLTGGGVDVFGLRRLPAQFPIACALQFRDSPGTHSISVAVDGLVAGDIPFQVFQTPDM